MRMYKVRSAEYILIYKSIVIVFFLRLKIHKIGIFLPRFDIGKRIFVVSINIRYVVLFVKPVYFADLASIKKNSRFCILCYFNVELQPSTLANIEIALDEFPLFAWVPPHINAGDAFIPRGSEGHFSDNTMHWPNADVMMVHRLRRWANILPTKTL